MINRLQLEVLEVADAKAVLDTSLLENVRPSFVYFIFSGRVGCAFAGYFFVGEEIYIGEGKGEVLEKNGSSRSSALVLENVRFEVFLRKSVNVLLLLNKHVLLLFHWRHVFLIFTAISVVEGIAERAFFFFFVAESIFFLSEAFDRDFFDFCFHDFSSLNFNPETAIVIFVLIFVVKIVRFWLSLRLRLVIFRILALAVVFSVRVPFFNFVPPNEMQQFFLQKFAIELRNYSGN